MRHRSLRGGYILIGSFVLCFALHPAEVTELISDLLAGAAHKVERVVDDTAGHALALVQIAN
ncbi:MAG: hypothetical protein MI824_14520 [Hyphomicrobiales bacterium]|nr:hypothetical protein [Hyphomicrobiales bacterium]